MNPTEKLLNAALELQQLRAFARSHRGSLLGRAAYRSAQLLCREMRSGDYLREVPNVPYRTLLPE